MTFKPKFTIINHYTPNGLIFYIVLRPCNHLALNWFNNKPIHLWAIVQDEYALTHSFDKNKR